MALITQLSNVRVRSVRHI